MKLKILGGLVAVLLAAGAMYGVFAAFQTERHSGLFSVATEAEELDVTLMAMNSNFVPTADSEEFCSGADLVHNATIYCLLEVRNLTQSSAVDFTATVEDESDTGLAASLSIEVKRNVLVSPVTNGCDNIYDTTGTVVLADAPLNSDGVTGAVTLQPEGSGQDVVPLCIRIQYDGAQVFDASTGAKITINAAKVVVP